MTGFSAGGSGASGVAIQADGRIVVVGTAGQGWDTKFALARYNSDGTLDATFGVKGKVQTGFTSGSDSARGVAIQADGKIVVVGGDGSGHLVPSDTKFALARYNSDGTLDASFGGGGKVTTDFTPWGDGASGVAIQADGRIVVAGTAAGQRYEDTKFALARYTSDGTLDATFGAAGKVDHRLHPERRRGRRRRHSSRREDRRRRHGQQRQIQDEGRARPIPWPVTAHLSDLRGGSP